MTPPPGWLWVMCTSRRCRAHRESSTTPEWIWWFSLGEHWTEAGEPTGTGGTVDFRTDVFDADSIETLIERLERVLIAMTADPTLVGCLGWFVLDAGEHAGADGWGSRAALTARPAGSVSVVGLWDAQVARTPGSVALVCGDHCLTYRQVDEAANGLAHLLAGYGAGAGCGGAAV